VSDAATGLGVAGVAVSTSPVDPGNAFVGFTFTDADGNYAISSRPGSYKVGFSPPQGSGLFFEFYDNVQDFGIATVVVVGGAPVTGIDAELGSDQDLSAPAPVDARIAQVVGTTDFVELGDAFTVTFSHRMDTTTTGDTLQLQDGDGTMVTLRCGGAPNDVACVWDDTGTVVTIAVEVNALDAVPAPGSPGSGTTPGLQIPFTITGLTGFADARGFIAYVLGAPDPIVDFE